MPSALSALARQFGHPSGPAGRLVTQLLARSNGPFNRWLVDQLGITTPAATRIIELGCGPGIGLQQLLSTFPAARVVGVDPSRVVLKSARRRNAAAVAEGRLTLINGDVTALPTTEPADLALACHVLYFWTNPVQQLQLIRDRLTPDGNLALGYQLRAHMPPQAQHNFEREGFCLYDSDEQLGTLLQQAGFTRPEVTILGDPTRPGGRLALSHPATG